MNFGFHTLDAEMTCEENFPHSPWQFSLQERFATKGKFDLKIRPTDRREGGGLDTLDFGDSHTSVPGVPGAQPGLLWSHTHSAATQRGLRSGC